MYQKVNQDPISVPSPIEYRSQDNQAQRQIVASLIGEYVTPNLMQHLLSVECAMYELAHHYQESDSAETWALSGLLHDIDWDTTQKDAKLHCGPETRNWLKQASVDQDLIENACSHYGLINVGDQVFGFEAGAGLPVDSILRKALFAVDELCGFIIACALVRPSKSIMDMEVSSVMKKFKDKGFAAQVDRNLIKSAELTLNTELKEFVDLTLKAMQKYGEVLEKKAYS